MKRITSALVLTIMLSLGIVTFVGLDGIDQIEQQMKKRPHPFNPIEGGGAGG